MKILLEFAPISLMEASSKPEDLIKFIEQNQYDIQVFNTKNQMIEKMNKNQLFKEYNPKKMNFVNLLCLRE